MELSLRELAELSGETPRTIRSYIVQGLLRGPETTGRNARYAADQLNRLLAIRVLRDLERLSLADIRQQLLTASPDDINAIARRWPPAGSRQGAAGLSEGTSAFDYVRALIDIRETERLAPPTISGSQPPKSAELRDPTPPPADQAPSDHRIPGLPALLPPRQRVTNLDRLLDRLRGDKEESAPERARSEVWSRIRVTPDVELSVRGPLSEEDRKRLLRIADHLREILMGGSK